MRLYGALQELTSLVIRLASGKTVKIQAAEQTAAGETQITIPDVVDGADTVVLVDTQQTLTNKTLTAPTMTNAAINSTTNLKLPVVNNPQALPKGVVAWSQNGNLLIIGGSDTPTGATDKIIVDEKSTQTLENKTISGVLPTSLVVSGGTIKGSILGGSGPNEKVSIDYASKINLSSLTTGVGNSHVLITDANGDIDSEATLSKSRGGTGVDLSNVDFPQNVTSKIVTNIAELTSVKLDRAAPSIATSVLTPSANKAVVQRITTAANFNEIANPEDGRYYIIMNASATDITIGNETGTAANQIITGTGAAFTFKAGTSIAAVYDGGSSKWRLSGGAGGAGGGTTDVITQVGHGFAVGDAVYLNGLVYTHAIATAANTAEVVGVVSKVVSNDAFELTLSGEISGLSGLTPGEVYFLGVDPLNPGKLTIVEPSVVGQVSLPVGVASSATTLYVAPKRGVVVGAANARTTISVGNNQATNVVSVTNYNSLKLEGELNVTRSSGGNQRAYYTVEAAKNGAGTWQVSASYTGDDVLYTTLPSWDVASNNLQVTMPLVTNFTSASLTYSLNAPAVGASLPLAIDSSSLNIVSEAPLSYRNRIINGDMRIDQRNSGAVVTVNTAANNYTLDRWQGYGQATDGVFTIQRVTDAPSGFNNSLKVTVTTADASIGASQIYQVSQRIEGYNVSDLELGKPTAKTFTASFWVKSSVAGTYSVSFGNNVDRSYPTTYTVNSANTWEYKTVIVVGATDGTWNYENGVGLIVHFDLGTGTSVRGTANTWANYPYAVTGSASLISTNGASLQITGVQLEVGSKASAFERRPYGMELALCQRYYYKVAPDGSNYLFFGWAKGYSVSNLNVVINHPVPLRAKATTLDLTALNTYAWETGSTLGNTPTTITIDGQVSNFNSTSLGVAKTSAFTAGAMYWFIANNTTTASIGIGAEL